MLHATVTYVMGTHEFPEQYRLDIRADGEHVPHMTARFYTADHDSTPAYDGAAEAALSAAKAVVGYGGTVRFA